MAIQFGASHGALGFRAGLAREQSPLDSLRVVIIFVFVFVFFLRRTSRRAGTGSQTDRYEFFFVTTLAIEPASIRAQDKDLVRVSSDNDDDDDRG